VKPPKGLVESVFSEWGDHELRLSQGSLLMKDSLIEAKERKEAKEKSLFDWASLRIRTSVHGATRPSPSVFQIL
jgi:hypothetical protein